MIYFTSDQHFNHEYVINYSERPFHNAEEMDNTIIQRYNEKVTDDDTVFFLGDIALASKEKTYEYIQRLKGNKIFIKGNHDKIDTHIESLVLKIEGQQIYLTHEPANIDLRYPLCLCGHVHEKWRMWAHDKFLVVNVGVDVWDFYPVTFSEIQQRIKKENPKRIEDLGWLTI